MSVTAKVSLYNTSVGEEATQLWFLADYNDGRNKEWATYTPALSVQMTVKNAIAEKYFQRGSSYTLTFDETINDPQYNHDD